MTSLYIIYIIRLNIYIYICVIRSNSSYFHDVTTAQV